MLEISKKSGEANGEFEDSQVVPISAELLKFFSLSREYQTQFSCTDESHRSRKFKFCQKNEIKEFITYTMFFKKWSEGSSLTCTNEEEVVENITEKIIWESRKYNHEVHFNVIWVYFFTYCDEGINSIPVFKIHFGVGKRAVYLDAFGKVYQTWNCFIDGPDLGKSLLCVPRNGEYYFVEGKLSLEFVQTKNMQSECIPSSNSWVKQVVPVFLSLENWVRESIAWLNNHPKLKSKVQEILNEVSKNKVFENKALNLAVKILLAFFDLPFGKTNGLAKLCIQAVKIICQHCYSQGLDKFLPGIDKILAEKLIYYTEAKQIWELLNKPSKNWIEIMEAICCLIKKLNPN